MARSSPATHPICIRAGVFAESLPTRDLHVSPLRAFHLDGALIPAECLVDGASIHRVEAVSQVDYFHLER